MGLNIHGFGTIRLSTNDFTKSRKWYIDFLSLSPSSPGGSVGNGLVDDLQPIMERALKLGGEIYRGPIGK